MVGDLVDGIDEDTVTWLEWVDVYGWPVRSKSYGARKEHRVMQVRSIRNADDGRTVVVSGREYLKNVDVSLHMQRNLMVAVRIDVKS